MPDPTVTFWPAGTAPAEADQRPGDFLLTRNDSPWYSRNGVVSAGIRHGEYRRYRNAGVARAEARELSHWNHAVAVAGGGYVEALGAGVVASPYSKYVGTDFLYVQTDLSDSLRADADRFLATMISIRYGYLTDVSIGIRAETRLPLAFVAPRTVICSGLVAAMLGADCWRAWPTWVMPSDLRAYHGISATTLLAP